MDQVVGSCPRQSPRFWAVAEVMTAKIRTSITGKAVKTVVERTLRILLGACARARRIGTGDTSATKEPSHEFSPAARKATDQTSLFDWHLIWAAEPKALPSLLVPRRDRVKRAPNQWPFGEFNRRAKRSGRADNRAAEPKSPPSLRWTSCRGPRRRLAGGYSWATH